MDPSGGGISSRGGGSAPRRAAWLSPSVACIARALVAAAACILIAQGARALVVEEYSCVRDGQERLIWLRVFEGTSGSTCDVRYSKRTELFDHDEVLWKAQALAYCREKAELLQEKLGRWQWQCGPRQRLRSHGTAARAEVISDELEVLRSRYMAVYPDVSVRVVGDMLAEGDLNLDGKADVALVFTTEARRLGVRPTIAVLLGNDDGALDLAATRPLGARWPAAIDIRENRIVVKLGAEGSVPARTAHAVFRLQAGRLLSVASDPR